MNRKLRSWISDSVAADMQTSYQRQLEIPFGYEFMRRYADFYTNLLTMVINVLNHRVGEFAEMTGEERRAELLSLAHGLEIFDGENNHFQFDGINKNDNSLYVAVIYYLCNYEAVANLYLRDCNFSLLKTDFSKIIYFIISGGNLRDYNDNVLMEYFLFGQRKDTEDFIDNIIKRNQELRFDNIDDFFDCQLLEHVLIKFYRDNIRKDLYHYDSETDWTRYIKYSVSKHIFSFLPSQREALNKGLLNFRRSFSLHMPTSAGKSYLTELVIYQEIKKNKGSKILYLAPLRSLGRELKDKYRRISHRLGFTFRCLYGGSNMSTTESILDDADLLITTPETFMSLEGAIDDLLNQFSLVICDEGQLIESEQRGLDYEMLLTRLKKNEHIRFLFISAIIPNIGDINSWLGGSNEEVGQSNYRPCTIRYGVAQESDRNITLDVYDNPNSDVLFKYNPFVSRRESRGITLNSKMSLSCLMALKSVNAGSVMLYCTYKNGNSACFKYGEKVIEILSKKHLPTPRSFLTDDQIESLEEIEKYLNFNYGKDYYETRFIQNGFVVHTGDVPQDLREIIEEGYSSGVIRLIICNSTLAEGVNFPIKTLVLGNIGHPKEYRKLMNKETLMNVIGRVGRAGQETYGMVICLADKWWYIKQAANGDGLTPAKGILNDIVQAIVDAENEFGMHLSDEGINEILENKVFNKSIDEMIMLNSDNLDLDNTTSDDIASGTLTYHLGDDDTKKEVKRMFTVRYNYLKDLPKKEYDIYKEAHINPNKVSELDKLIKSNLGLDAIDIKGLGSEKWINDIVNLVYALNEDYNEDYDSIMIIKVLKRWIHGYKYIAIADDLKMPIEDIVTTILWIQGDFLQSSKTIIRYICLRYNIHNDSLDNWSTMVEKGTDSSFEIMMLKMGLSDRMALHYIADWLSDEYPKIKDREGLRDALTESRREIIARMEYDGFPRLTINRFIDFLRL